MMPLLNDYIRRPIDGAVIGIRCAHCNLIFLNIIPWGIDAHTLHTWKAHYNEFYPG